MLFPQVDPLEWAKIYNINCPSGSCYKCSAQQNFTIPFAYNDFRGLLSSHTDCGDEYRQSVFIAVDKNETKQIAEFIAQFSVSVGL